MLRRNLIELKDALKARDIAEEKKQELVEELQDSLANVKKSSFATRERGSTSPQHRPRRARTAS